MKRKHIKSGGGLNAHAMVAAMAIEMAQAMWEVYAQDNVLYRKMRADGTVTEKAARRLFVERVAPRMLEEARGALVDLMTAPNTPQYSRDQIEEALILDSDLRANRFVAADQAIVPAHLH